MTAHRVTAVLIALALQGPGFAAQPGKVLERTLFEATPQHLRYTQGAVLALDGKGKQLLMVVSVFGSEVGDTSEAELVGWRSNDGGFTWGERHVFQRNFVDLRRFAPGARQKGNVKNASFLRLSKSEVLCFFNAAFEHVKDAGLWMRRSLDNARSWSEPERLPYDGYGGMNSDGAVRTRRGRIVLPCWVSRDGLRSTYAYSFYSDDRGRTWRRSNEITVHGSKGRRTDPSAEEPAVVELEDGRLLMMLRTYTGWYYRSHSADSGATWAEPTRSTVAAPGAMPRLVRIPTTRDLLLVFNHGEPPEIKGPLPRNRLASLVSRDEGETFESLQILDGGADFPGKITMANVTFAGRNALVFYSKSLSRKNEYHWMQQILPVSWFYGKEGGKRP